MIHLFLMIAEFSSEHVQWRVTSEEYLPFQLVQIRVESECVMRECLSGSMSGCPIT